MSRTIFAIVSIISALTMILVVLKLNDVIDTWSVALSPIWVSTVLGLIFIAFCMIFHVCKSIYDDTIGRL